MEHSTPLSAIHIIHQYNFHGKKGSTAVAIGPLTYEVLLTSKVNLPQSDAVLPHRRSHSQFQREPQWVESPIDQRLSILLTNFALALARVVPFHIIINTL